LADADRSVGALPSADARWRRRAESPFAFAQDAVCGPLGGSYGPNGRSPACGAFPAVSPLAIDAHDRRVDDDKASHCLADVWISRARHCR